MNNSVIHIHLDVQKIQSQTNLKLHVGDTAKTIVFLLEDGGKPYILGKDCEAVFRAVGRNSGVTLFNHCNIVNNRVIYRPTRSMIETSDEFDCELDIYGGNDTAIPQDDGGNSDTPSYDGPIESVQ